MEQPSVSKQVLDLLRAVLLEKSVIHASIDNITYLKDLRLNKWYTFGSERDYQEYWEDLRSKERVLDFIVEVTIDFDLFLKLEQLPALEELSELMGKTFDYIKNNDKGSVTDVEFNTRRPEQGTANVLKQNPWMTTIILISRTNVLPAITMMNGVLEGTVDPTKKTD